MIEELKNAKRDYLTDFYTREGLFPFIEKMVVEANEHNVHFSLLLLDIDHFKSFNDKYGHLHGDSVLRHVSSTINRALTHVDSAVFRFGGDEFIVVLPGKSVKDAVKISNIIQKSIMGDPFLLLGQMFKFSFSGGLVYSATDGRTVEELLGNADRAMYLSKKHGRARTILYSKIRVQGAGKVVKAIAIGCVILTITIALLYFFKDHIQAGLANIKSLHIAMPKSAALDEICMKKGEVFNGVIIREDNDEVELQLVLEPGKGSMVIRKSDIKSIVRAR